MLKCLKSWSNWEPEAAREFDEKIDPLLADEAGVDLETFQSAKNMIWWDGHYGPYQDADFEAEGHKISKSQALDIIEKAREYRFDDIKYQDPDVETCCPYEEMCDHPNVTIEGQTIYNEVWRWYKEIYG